MPFGQCYVAINIYNISKGHLGSRGERGCTSKRRHQTSDKNTPHNKMVVFIGGVPLIYNFGRGHYGKHSCEIILNLDQWFRRCRLEKKFTTTDGHTPDARWRHITIAHVDARVHRWLVYMYLLNVPGFSNPYFLKKLNISFKEIARLIAKNPLNHQ